MTKLEQLEWMRQHGCKVPAFEGLVYEDWKARGLAVHSLSYPLAVRSSFGEEDGEDSSWAGQFATMLGVGQEGLKEAVGTVFSSYPDPEGQVLILQEMVSADYSGVLFAFREGAWKAELTDGLAEELVSGKREGTSFLLPRFSQTDAAIAKVYDFWGGPGVGGRRLRRALAELSTKAGQLLAASAAAHGLDIEFAVAGHQVWLLQARPITTPQEAEVVLTSANHKEILPPRPSRLMTSLITGAGYELFQYYRRLDPTLPDRPFLAEAAGMPWINLSALLDTMVHWGLPTQLVCRSVGAEDFYKVGLRPWQGLRKIGVFFRVLAHQMRAARATRLWQEKARERLLSAQADRKQLWQADPAAAFAQWAESFRQLYVALVTHMQNLTGAMSGPVALLEKLGLLGIAAQSLSRQSISTDYMSAFRSWQAGELSQEAFLERFGHRGFYESDIGQPRFYEYEEADWARLRPEKALPPLHRLPMRRRWFACLAQPLMRLVHAREEVRHETMKLFWAMREELQQHLDFSPWGYRVEALHSRIRDGEGAPTEEEIAGWDMDTFLYNQFGRRLPLAVLGNVSQGGGRAEHGIGICPGKVEGVVWRVRTAGDPGAARPQGEKVILVADALDPGWVPYFGQVDGVVSYVGGLLSHASIMLREAGVPAITQLPAHIKLEQGDHIVMDGRTGTVSYLAVS